MSTESKPALAFRSSPVLGGNRGLTIFQTGFPASQSVACDDFATLTPVEETVSPGHSGLTYDATADQYVGHPEILGADMPSVRDSVTDGSFHIGNFRFDLMAMSRTGWV